ncbi:MafI family immunity protein [Micromonospora sp. NPDC047644]|uniref:MafI family immunity protein n=1 Tax=Micromonospora sp. NPDC047644 TaxID=3157203 RepID=UPI00345372B4
MDFGQAQARVLKLLDDAPALREGIRTSIREYVRDGEAGLGFATLCEFLYEDALPISRAYYERLTAAAAEFDDLGSMERLNELIRE